MAHPHNGPEGPCPNCGHPLTADDRFCPRCGQENHSLKIPIGHLLYETVEGIFHFDNKFFRTLWQSITRPGLIVHDFLEGRRARYVPPIRLYIFVSVIFFFLVNQRLHQRTSHGNINFSSKPKVLSENRDAVEMPEDSTSVHDGEIAMGDKIVTLNGVRSDGPRNLTGAIIQDRAERRGFAGLEVQGSLDAMSYRQRVEAFLPALRQRMLQEPDTAKYAGWKKAKAKVEDAEGRIARKDSLVFFSWRDNLDTLVLTGFRKALTEEDEDTLLPLQADGKTLLRYQPRFMGVPSDSAAMISYQRFTENAQVDSLFARYGRHLDFMERLLFKRTIYFVGIVQRGETDVMGNVWLPLLFKYLSISMFLLMPVAGFILLLFFYKKRRYYYEHLVFSIYTHSMVFIILSFTFLIRILAFHTAFSTIADYMAGAIAFSVLIYFVLSLKRVYSQGWPVTLLKSFGITILYGSCLLSLAVSMVLLSLATF